MRPALREIDRPLAAVAIALAAYGLAALYSACQTDVPPVVATIKLFGWVLHLQWWHKQLIWLTVGTVAAILIFRTSPRLLE